MVDDFIIIKDPHFRFGRKKPVGRKLSFFDEISDKIDFIINYCKEHKVENILFTGDILDQKDPSKYSFPVYRKIICELERFTNSGLTLFSIMGNHDTVDGQSELSVYTELVKRGLITDLSYDLGSDPYTGRGFTIFGISHKYDLSEFESVLTRIESLSKREAQEWYLPVLVIHQNVAPNITSFIEEKFITYNYSQLHDMAPSVGVWICGHYHKGYPIEKIANSTFLSPYSLTRLSRGEPIKDHIPQMIHANFGRREFNTIDIPCRSYGEAFDLEEVEQISKVYSEINLDFIQDIKGLSQDNKITLDEIPDEIKSRVEEYLNKAEGELNK